MADEPKPVTTSIPFWDSGEYIATSYILGIPHPPGTPLYVLVGRLFAMLPFGNVHLMVNWLSAVASALTGISSKPMRPAKYVSYVRVVTTVTDIGSVTVICAPAASLRSRRRRWRPAALPGSRCGS